ncbi:dienelactone hydrolase endo-1-3,1,4-beta-D-glucanase [Panaeolus papilionaceus]|nr:dienelactone hydrolase endo-1-3,1,4-beta-D-glucanase [Panaeolus papilionaceus]
MSCAQCSEGFVLPGEPKGEILPDYQGAYYAIGPEGERGRVIIFLTDGFGLPLKNCKLMADNLATRLRCDVWVPDYLAGRPLVDLDDLRAPDRAGVKLSIIDKVKWIVLSVLPKILAYISNRPSVVDKRVKGFISLLQERKKYEKVGMVGYCWGGATTMRLAKKDLICSAAMCHPAPFSVKDVHKIQIPTSWALAEDDLFVSPSLRNNAEAILSARKGMANEVEYEFKDYPGTAHGFAARPNLNLPAIKAAYEQAFEQVVLWFERTL